MDKKMKLTAQVRRFGHTFRVEYDTTSTKLDNRAALYKDDQHIAWLGVSVLESSDTPTVIFDVSDDYEITLPQMFGMSEVTKDAPDHKFLLEAEDYLMMLLSQALSEKLTQIEWEDKVIDPRSLHPEMRARRIIEDWHNHDNATKHLPKIIAIEICDVVEGFGYLLADYIDLIDIPKENCGDVIRQYIQETLETWSRGEES